MEQEIILLEKEKNLFDFLLAFIQEEKLNVVLRVAGGWVRDKLMGQHSHDIDIALDTMMGEQFVLSLEQYMQKKGEKLRGHGKSKISSAQSKHLETAMCVIQGQSIDFVNLRGEEYGEDSRIPLITFGTPEQDAFRRDLTINSLFYNVNSKKIEDLTQMGFSDLNNKIIRTPLEPFKTFMDDPLRILRCFRFATRFQFTIMPEILEAAQNLEVQNSFINKISKERITIETEKILRGNNSIQGITLIYQTQIWKHVFKIPDESLEKIDIQIIQQNSYQYAQVLSNLLQTISFDQFDALKENDEFDDEKIQLLLYLSCITSAYQEIKVKQGKYFLSGPNYLLSLSLKFPKDFYEHITRICNHVSILNELIEKFDIEKDYLQFVRFMRNIGKFYQVVVLVGKVQKIQQKVHEKEIERYDNFIKQINQKGIQRFYQVKSILNGNVIKEEFDIIKVGSDIKRIQLNVIQWQAYNLTKTGEELMKQIAIDPELKEKLKNSTPEIDI